MDMFDLAGTLFGNRANPVAQGPSLTATGSTSSVDGVAGVTFDGDVTPAEDVGEDVDQTVIDLPTSPDVAEGDEVIVTLVGDGPLKTPIVTANPGSGDRMAAAVQDAHDLAASVEGIAQEAKEVAEATGQHFWPDSDGVHVTEVTQDEWNDSTSPSYHSGANVLLNALGQLFRDGLNNLLALVGGSTPGVAIYDGAGNAAGNVVASFTGEGIVMGRTNDYNLAIDSDSLDMRNADHLITTFDSSYNDYGTGVQSQTHIIVEPNPDYDPVNNWDGVSRGAGYLRATADSMEPTSGTANDYENVVRLAASSNSINGDTGHVFESAIQLRNSGTDGATTVDSSVSLIADNLYLSAIGGQGGSGMGQNFTMAQAIQALNCTTSGPGAYIEADSGTASRLFYVGSTLDNSASAYDGRRGSLYVMTSGLWCYTPSTPTESGVTHWSLTLPSGTTDLRVSTANLTLGTGAASWANGYYTTYGKFVVVTMQDVKLKSALASGSTSPVICTLPAGARPHSVQRVPCAISATGNYANVWAAIGGSGQVQIANRSNTSIPTTATISLNCCYIID